MFLRIRYFEVEKQNSRTQVITRKANLTKRFLRWFLYASRCNFDAESVRCRFCCKSEDQSRQVCHPNRFKIPGHYTHSLVIASNLYVWHGSLDQKYLGPMMFVNKYKFSKKWLKKNRLEGGRYNNSFYPSLVSATGLMIKYLL